jgi:hypothetical protein
VRLVSTAVIVGYLAFAVGYTAPSGTIAHRFWRRLDRPLYRLSLAHSWQMFAPDPLYVHRRLRVLFVFVDGDELEWLAPQYEELSFWRKFFELRMVKYFGSMQRTRGKWLGRPLVDFLVDELELDRSRLKVAKVSSLYRRVLRPGSATVFSELKEWPMVSVHFT